MLELNLCSQWRHPAPTFLTTLPGLLLQHCIFLCLLCKLLFQACNVLVLISKLDKVSMAKSLHVLQQIKHLHFQLCFEALDAGSLR